MFPRQNKNDSVTFDDKEADEVVCSRAQTRTCHAWISCYFFTSKCILPTLGSAAGVERFSISVLIDYEIYPQTRDIRERVQSFFVELIDTSIVEARERSANDFFAP